MRRSTPSFTVEVRRTSKRAAGPKTQAWLSETTPKISEATHFSQLAASAPFRAKPPEAASHEVLPPSGAGRILPSLIDEDPAGRVLLDIPSSKQKTAPATRQQSKPRHRGVRTSAPVQETQPGTEADAPTAENGAVAQASVNVAPPDQTVAAPQHAQPVAAEPKVRVKRASRKATSGASERNQIAPGVAGQTTTRELSAKAASPEDPQDAPTPVRKRHVIGRYAVSEEFKPGERWKRLLRWKR